jgi:hypothetical protein
MRQILTFLSNADNCFGVTCIALAPLFAVVVIGLLGSGA